MTTCSLRPYEADDAKALWEAARESSPEVFRWLPWCHPQYSMAEATEWTRSRAALAAEGHEYSFAIIGSDGRFLGACGINQINRIHRFANAGYWVRTSATGRGVATEALRQLAELAFRTPDLVRLEVVCAVGNDRSQRVAERAGAVREGILRGRLLLHGHAVDAVMYSFVRAETGEAPNDKIRLRRAMTREESEAFAADWAEAWNARAVERVLEHFHDDVVFTSPTALAVVGSATVRGKDALRAYWTAALDRIGSMHFTIDRVLWDPERRELALLYTSEINGSAKRVSENLTFDHSGKVVAAEVFHGVPREVERA